MDVQYFRLQNFLLKVIHREWMTTTGDGLCFSNKFFTFYHEKSACKFLTKLFTTKHFVSYSKITLYQKKACLQDKWLQSTLVYNADMCNRCPPTAAIRINVNWEIRSNANSGPMLTSAMQNTKNQKPAIPYCFH